MPPPHSPKRNFDTATSPKFGSPIARCSKLVSTQIATQTEIVTLRLSRLSECCRMIRLMQYQEKDLLILHQSDHATAFPSEALGPHGNTQHFTLYFEMCFVLSVSFSAAYSCGLYLGTGISTHVSEGVRVSEGAHREHLAQELTKEGSHIV